MPYFSTIHRLNAFLLPPLGLFVNFLLFWLVIRKTPKEMYVHSRILLQTCFLDILLLGFNLVGMPVLIILPNCTVCIFEGYLIVPFQQAFGPWGLIILCTLVLSTYYFDLYGVIIQFFYRYLVLNRNIRITFRRYLLMAVPFYLALSLFLALFLSPYDVQIDQRMDLNYFNNSLYFQNDNIIFLRIILPPNSSIQDYLYLFVMSISLYILYYVLIIFCAYKMIAYMNSHVDISGQLRELNRQLTRTLIILAIIPCILIGIEIASSLNVQFTLLTGTWTMSVHLALAIFTSWLPLFNPIVALLTNKPYKTALKEMCARRWKKIKINPMNYMDG